MNRWKRTIRKRRKKQRETDGGAILMFRGNTAAVCGVWSPTSRRPRPPPLEEQGRPNIAKLLEDCEAKPPQPSVAQQLDDLLNELDE